MDIKAALQKAQSAINEALAACGDEGSESPEHEASELPTDEGDELTGSTGDMPNDKESKKAAMAAMISKKFK